MPKPTFDRFLFDLIVSNLLLDSFAGKSRDHSLKWGSNGKIVQQQVSKLCNKALPQTLRLVLQQNPSNHLFRRALPSNSIQLFFFPVGDKNPLSGFLKVGILQDVTLRDPHFYPWGFPSRLRNSPQTPSPSTETLNPQVPTTPTQDPKPETPTQNQPNPT